MGTETYNAVKSLLGINFYVPELIEDFSEYTIEVFGEAIYKS